MAFESNNPGDHPDTLEVKLDSLQRAGILLLVLAVIFSVIGYFVSPHDETGKPILLLPEVKQMEAYRRSSFQWIEDFRTLDGQIVTITANQQGDLFSQSREAQSALQLAVQLAQDIDRTACQPAGGTGIHIASILRSGPKNDGLGWRAGRTKARRNGREPAPGQAFVGIVGGK